MVKFPRLSHEVSFYSRVVQIRVWESAAGCIWLIHFLFLFIYNRSPLLSSLAIYCWRNQVICLVVFTGYIWFVALPWCLLCLFFLFISCTLVVRFKNVIKSRFSVLARILHRWCYALLIASPWDRKCPVVYFCVMLKVTSGSMLCWPDRPFIRLPIRLSPDGFCSLWWILPRRPTDFVRDDKIVVLYS